MTPSPCPLRPRPAQIARCLRDDSSGRDLGQPPKRQHVTTGGGPLGVGIGLSNVWGTSQYVMGTVHGRVIHSNTPLNPNQGEATALQGGEGGKGTAGYTLRVRGQQC